MRVKRFLSHLISPLSSLTGAGKVNRILQSSVLVACPLPSSFLTTHSPTSISAEVAGWPAYLLIEHFILSIQVVPRHDVRQIAVYHPFPAVLSRPALVDESSSWERGLHPR